MFTNKLNPNGGGGKKMYTQEGKKQNKKKPTHYTIFV